MFSVARAARGLTQSQLAKTAGVTQALISKLEAGLTVDPSEETVEALASSLRVPVAFFMSSERPHGMPQFHYRKRAKLGRRALDMIEAQINIRRIHASRLLQGYEVDGDGFPIIDLEAMQWTPQQAAEHIRGLWMLPRGPIENLSEAVERAGAIIVQIDFGTSLLDALSFRLPGLPPLIFMNSNVPGDRYRFTLAHEVAHLVLHNSPETDENMELQADQFASELLMPTKEIRPYLVSPSLGSLARVKPYWKVSIKSLIVRCERLKVVTPNQYTGLMVNYSKAGYAQGEPFPIQVEEATLLKAALEYHLSSLGYTAEELATLLLMQTEEFQETYTPRPRLRLVK